MQSLQEGDLCFRDIKTFACSVGGNSLVIRTSKMFSCPAYGVRSREKGCHITCVSRLADSPYRGLTWFHDPYVCVDFGQLNDRSDNMLQT